MLLFFPFCLKFRVHTRLTVEKRGPRENTVFRVGGSDSIRMYDIFISICFLLLFILFLSPATSSPIDFIQTSSRTLFGSDQEVSYTLPDDVKRTGVGAAFCDLTLQSHCDRVLSKVKDPKALIDMLLPRGLERTKFYQNLDFGARKLISEGCDTTSVKISVHTKLRAKPRALASFYLSNDFPAQDRVPLLHGEVSRKCRVVSGNKKERLFLRHVDIYKLEHDDADSENDRTLMLSFGAEDIVIDISDLASVSLHVILSCTDRDDLKKGYVELASNIQVGVIRKLLLIVGISPSSARSFMVAGFHSRDL